MSRSIIFAVLLSVLQACGVKQEIRTEVFRDDFITNLNEWDEAAQGDIEKFFQNGHYTIINTRNAWTVWSTVDMPVNPDEDFIIETSAALNWHSMGPAYLIYGVDQANSDFHFLAILKAGNAMNMAYIGKRINGQWTGVTKDVRLNPYGASNILTVHKRGEVLFFSVNNKVVHRQEFEPFFGNRIGVGCGENQSVSFDYLVIKQDGRDNVTTGNN